METDPWYENAVIYALDVETFMDDDGDGVGDFEGLIDRLDYLDRLGVTAVWLLPFYPTPNRDNGYDVTDYYGVDPRLGTLGDFVEFVDAADDHGIRVITDLVVNHTSDEHPWFRRSRSEPDSAYRDYYVWAEELPPPNPDRGSVFPGEVEDERVWTYDSEAGAYYYHRFYPFQPDLDLSNPDVREEIYKIMNFWLQLGVDGFRVDAATLMIQSKHPDADEPEDPHELLRSLKRHVVARRPDGILLAEADDDPGELRAYFGDPPDADGEGEREGAGAGADAGEGEGKGEEKGPRRGEREGRRGANRGDEMDLLMNFVLNAHLIAALATGRAAPLAEGLDRIPHDTSGNFANFLRNYDELNIGRLPTALQREVFDRFAPEEEMRIYGRGIRRRLAPMVDGDRRRLELAYSLLFSLPGTPILLYGDEIGMGDDPSLPGRQSVRTPMQWDDRPNAGFSTADADALVAPVVDDGPFRYQELNVADQRADPDSLLAWMERLIAVRKETHAIGSGRYEPLETNDDAVFAHRVDGPRDAAAFVHNLSDEDRRVAVDLTGGDESLHPLFGDPDVRSPADGPTSVDLEQYGYGWFEIREP